MFSKRCLAGQQFVERRSQRIDVRANVDLMRIAALFRCHVIECAHDLSGRRQFCGRLVGVDDGLLKDAGEAKVQHFDNGLWIPICSRRLPPASDWMA